MERMTIAEAKTARDKFIKEVYHIDLYPFQREISDTILEGVMSGDGRAMGFEVSRQAGKTTAIVLTCAFLMIFCKYIIGRHIRVAIFAPQKEQTKTDFDLIKDHLTTAKQSGFESVVDEKESNSTTLKLSNNSICYTFALTETSNIESKTTDINIFEEANSINDKQKRKKADPMLTSTNGPEISVGVAGYSKTYFRAMENAGKVKKFDCNEVVKQKREAYERDGDTFHLNYERKVEQKRQEWGEDNPEFQTQYLLKWVLGAGQFMVADEFDKLVGGFERVYQDKTNECFVGIDTAKMPDSTIVTVLRMRDGKQRKQLINWLELQGDNYQDQFDIINDFISHYNVRAMAIDSTGQGDFMPDMFERNTYFRDENTGLYRVKFSLVTKDALYKNLVSVVRNFLTEIPNPVTKEAERFKQQMLDLQKEYKGTLLSCHHPDFEGAHDDYPDSWALAEYACAQVVQKPELDITFF